MKTSYKGASLRILTVLLLLSLPLLGSDCEDIINQLNTTCTDAHIDGSWTLIYNAGTLHDICPGEILELPSPSNGTATLTCPNGTPLSRLYTIQTSGNVTNLNYTETGMNYEVTFTETCEMVLTGPNNNRILYYTTTVSDKKPNTTTTDKNTVNYNSSELK
jgi:hypothetical protein